MERLPSDAAAGATSQLNARISRWLAGTSTLNFAAFSIGAAFCTYFCMYAFRKPFTAGEFGDVSLLGVGYKTILIASQVGGYTLSKFIGIKVISEMPARRRAAAILLLILWAEAALILFALVPPPWNFPLLFLNGLPLGMVFGLVLSFLEGRQLTEMLTAGLCASFIVSSGFVKFVGRSLILDYGVSEYWMPAVTGLLFVVPLVVSVLLLSCIPRPTSADIADRSERQPMDRAARRGLFRRHALGLSGLVFTFILLTIIRSIRDDFAVEIWNDLGYDGQPSVFATSELAVMFGVLLINGSAVLIRNNRRALLSALGLVFGGFMLVLFSLWGHRTGLIAAYPFMVLIGLGTYIPYVAFHTTVFERLLSAFRERGNIGYLMYLADATGYLGYIAVMAAKGFLPDDVNFLNLFAEATLWISLVASAVTLLLVVHYRRTLPRPPTVPLGSGEWRETPLPAIQDTGS